MAIIDVVKYQFKEGEVVHRCDVNDRTLCYRARMKSFFQNIYHLSPNVSLLIDI